MPVARFQMPDGRIARFDVPEGTTPEQAQSLMSTHFGAQSQAPKQQQFAANPTEGNSFLGNAAAGVGSAMTDLALGAKQRLDEGAAYLENKFGGQKINQSLGLKNAADIQKETQAAVVDKRQLDAPLLATGGGKTGQFVGKAAPAVAAAFVPGGQTLLGSMVAGGGLGFVEPTVEGESAGKNALIGAGGGALGYAGGKAIAAGANKLAANSVKDASTNAARDAVAAGARDAGYVIPPVQTNPSLLNRTLEGLSGKISTAQSASMKNQSVTNKLVAESLGLPTDVPITKDALSALRSQAGRAYDAVKSVGTLKADQEYGSALNAISQKFQGASKDFPELAKNEIDDIVSSVNKPSFGADSAVDAIKILRERASSAYGKGDKTMGKAYREASDAMEGLIERNLQAGGQDGLLKSFREARQLIAKSYSVESALNPATGNVAARKLATQLTKGKPLSGELKDIGQFAQAFPKAADEVTSSMPGISPLDWISAGGLSAMTGNPLAMASVGARPLARSAILSRPYQNALAAPSYTGSTTLNALASNPSRLALQAGGVMSPNFTKK